MSLVIIAPHKLGLFMLRKAGHCYIELTCMLVGVLFLHILQNPIVWLYMKLFKDPGKVKLKFCE